jgi:hypothetical protein
LVHTPSEPSGSSRSPAVHGRPGPRWIQQKQVPVENPDEEALTSLSLNPPMSSLELFVLPGTTGAAKECGFSGV